MTATPSWVNPEFDDFADRYEEALERGISVSGESADFFAEERVNWLARCLARMSFSPGRVVDFGCGTGTATPCLLAMSGVRALRGIDVSGGSLEVARRRFGGRAQFQLCSDVHDAGAADVVYSNGVFHHIPPAERAAAIAFIWRLLRPGGVFALWENNPWNPGTRYVMSRIPFDRDARTLSAPESRRLLRAGGFEVLRTDFRFIFPRAMRWCRPVEPALAACPLGAQYQVLVRKPSPSFS